MKKSIIVFISIYFSLLNLKAQYTQGSVKDKDQSGIPGVIVYWKNHKNAAILSNENGDFKIKKITSSTWLIFEHGFYQKDSLKVLNDSEINISLKEAQTNLKSVEITAKSTFIDKLSPIQTEVLTTRTLEKAACCNLSESFETNASVSVSFSDAVTGAKQIQLLGLSGLYTQTNIENIPYIRGLNMPFGLNAIPGSWIQSIDIAKGAGSVLNGSENMVGAINVELKKPDQGDRLFLNGYLNSFGRAELNFITATKEKRKWSFGTLGHVSGMSTNINQNGDSFLDLPRYGQINLLERVKYQDENKMFQAGIKVMYDTRIGGQEGFKSRSETPLLYGFGNTTFRPEFFMKIAKLYPMKPYKGVGFIFHTARHDSKSFFGFKPYDALQQTVYANLIYQNILFNTKHTYKTGLSFLNDNYDEKLGAFIAKRNEVVPGAFFEYTFNNLDRTILSTGLRLDQHNLYGTRFSPRVHFKHELNQQNTIRLSVGRAYRVANVFADNYGYLISSRAVRILEKLNPETSWNFGGTYQYEKGRFNMLGEYFQTRFENQVIADTEHPEYLYFYNLNGKSVTHNAMFEINYELSKALEFKIAYRYTDSKQSLGKPYGENVYLPKMFLAKDRILFNAAYALPYDKWKLDFTWQWNGRRRIMDPNTRGSHDSYNSIKSIYAPEFSNINAQISRNYTYFEWYLGGENLGNFKQKNPIIGEKEPFGSNFDAGMVWGPVTGAIIYSGFRYKLQ